jgi:hypothetical protein
LVPVNYFFGGRIQGGKEVGGERAEIDAGIHGFDRSRGERIGQSGRGGGRWQCGRGVEVEGKTGFGKEVSGDLWGVGGTIAKKSWSGEND